MDAVYRRCCGMDVHKDTIVFAYWRRRVATDSCSERCMELFGTI